MLNPIQTYFEDLQQILNEFPIGPIEAVIDLLHEARLTEKKIFIMGNGGSASTASHFVCDLAKNTRSDHLPHFKVIGLNDNMAIFSALANDEGYESVFSGQLANLVQAQDIVIGISTSGNSPNVLAAIALARDHGAITIGFTGFDGGRLANLVDINLHVPSETIEYVEDLHLVLEHVICRNLKDIPQNRITNDIGETVLFSD